jgi:hypothetical protein
MRRQPGTPTRIPDRGQRVLFDTRAVARAARLSVCTHQDACLLGLVALQHAVLTWPRRRCILRGGLPGS